LLHREGLGIVIGFVLLAIVVTAGAFLTGYLQIQILAALSVVLTLLVIYFFRDPERSIPSDERFILSPADGTVRYVKKIARGEILFSTKHRRKYLLDDVTKSQSIKDGAYLIGVEMHIMNVHVTRAPVSGKITLQRPTKGREPTPGDL